MLQNPSFVEAEDEVDGEATKTGSLLFDDECDSPWAAKEISRQNWVSKKNVPSCMNTSCNTKFSPFIRGRHCHRCGQVFCCGCVQFFLRLNKLAQPDPDGERHKVCKSCLDESRLDETEGHTRSYTDFFISQRDTCKHKALLKTVPDSDPKEVLNWLRTKLDFEKEFQRLLKGFETDVGKSKLKGALVELKNTVSTPKWLKPDLWNMAKIAKSCHLCTNSFDGQLSRTYCRVCGIHVCKTSECSSKDLLVYFPDKDKQHRESRKPKLAIIRIIGSPGVEPVISLYLRVCLLCREQLVQRQVKDHEEAGNTWTGQKFNDVLLALNGKVKEGEDLVKEQLPMFRDNVEALEDGELTDTQNNMELLTKIQADLDLVLDQHQTLVGQLKKLKPQSSSQASVLKHCVKAKADFYFNNVSVYKTIKKRLEEFVTNRTEEQKAEENSREVHRLLQEDSLTGTHVLMHQLMTETTELCEKYDLLQDLPACIRKLGTAILCDVQDYFKDKREEKKTYIDRVLNLAESRAKHNRLLCPSQSLLNKTGSKHLHEHMLTRAEHVLTQINQIIHSKANKKSMSRTKKALQIALKELKEHMEQNSAFDQEFVFVDSRND